MTEYCRPPTRPETLGCPRHHLLYLSTNRGSKGSTQGVIFVYKLVIFFPVNPFPHKSTLPPTPTFYSSIISASNHEIMQQKNHN